MECLINWFKVLIFRCYKTLSTIVAKDQPLDSLFTQLDENQLVKLLDFTSQWNTNTRTYAVIIYVNNLMLMIITLDWSNSVECFAEEFQASKTDDTSRLCGHG